MLDDITLEARGSIAFVCESHEQGIDWRDVFFFFYDCKRAFFFTATASTRGVQLPTQAIVFFALREF
jgi:hypothetical protein